MLLAGLGPRAGFGRKHYRKALQASAQALAKTGASDAVVYLALEDVPAMDSHYRARMVAEVFCAQSVPNPRSEDRREAQAAQARARERRR